MPFYTYILFSKSLNKFYIGSTSLSPVERLEQHNQIKFLMHLHAKEFLGRCF
ncbi:MAG: GIY-YIG nuclease family protein [Bacteroidetes bacterium]|nr:GIY-YIG nuclease family protein [Bacteroidota bacterium]